MLENIIPYLFVKKRLILTKKLFIQAYLKIKDYQVVLNGKPIFKDENHDIQTFLKNVYKTLEIKYSKFFKMDSLSKLAFLGAEILLNKTALVDRNTAIIFSNNASSLDTDRKYQNSINDRENYFPSPAVFVYTLPNIGIGEISIKRQLKSENAFFIFEKYNANFHHTYENCLIQTEKCNSVLAGWVNIDEDSCEAFLYLVSEKGNIEHTEKNLIRIYKD